MVFMMVLIIMQSENGIQTNEVNAMFESGLRTINTSFDVS